MYTLAQTTGQSFFLTLALQSYSHHNHLGRLTPLFYIPTPIVYTVRLTVISAHHLSKLESINPSDSSAATPYNPCDIW